MGTGILSTENLEALVKTASEKLMTILPQILIAIIAVLLLQRILRLALDKGERQMISVMARKSDEPRETEKRVNTLFLVARKVTFVLIWGIAALIVLKTIGVEIGPILAAAGVLGLAIGLGAQNIVKDIFTGIILLLENQIRVGDIVNINGKAGLVEYINLRTIVLRDLAGVVHVIPSGLVQELSNLTKDWSAIVFDIGVAYKEDPENVMTVMGEVARELREDPGFKERIIADMEVFGVDSFGDSAVVIRARFKTKPGDQFAIGREYRKRLKKAFDLRQIEIPFPHRTLYFGDASRPFEILSRANTNGPAGAAPPTQE